MPFIRHSITASIGVLLLATRAIWDLNWVSGDLSHALYTSSSKALTSGCLEKNQVKKRLGGSDFQFLMIAALSASYDPDLDEVNGVSLPIDRYSGERILSVGSVGWPLIRLST